MGHEDWMERLLNEMDAFIKDSAFQHVQAASEAQRVRMAPKHTGKVIVLANALSRQRMAG